MLFLLGFVILLLSHNVCAQTLSVVSPTSGTRWYLGQSYNIQWTSTGLSASASVKIELWKDNTFLDDLIATPSAATPNSGSFYWTPTSIVAGSSYYIYLTSGSTKGQGGNFAISVADISISSPFAATTWNTGASVTISWTSTNTQPTDLFSIILYTDGVLSDDVYATISSAANGSSYNFMVPYSWKSGSNYYVQIALNSDSTVKAKSANFNIRQLTRSLHILHPTKGEKFVLGRTVPITWASSEGIFATDTIVISLYNQGKLVLNISTVVNTGAYAWVPSLSMNSSDSYVVSVATSDNAVQTSSDSFSLTAEVPGTVTSLAGTIGDLVLAYFSDEAYSSGIMQLSYLYPYNGKCTTWNKGIEFRNDIYAKLAIYSSPALGALVIAFKGSDSTEDFIADANAPFDPCVLGGHTCGKVHGGFLTYYNAVRNTIFTALREANTTTYDLYVTGHSLGAALAMLAALDISFNFNSTLMESISLVTFGQPRVGDSGFVQVFNSRNINYTRYVDIVGSDSDIVTQNPPTSFGYMHANDPTIVVCSTCSGILVSFQLHSMNNYIAELQVTTGTSQMCANGCEISDSASIWQYLALPDTSGCTVQDRSELSLSVGSWDSDKFSVCLMTASQAYFYTYSNSKSCTGQSIVLADRVTDAIATVKSNISAGSYVVVVENHNSINFADMYYNISFSQGYKAPLPPHLVSVISASSDGTTVKLSWTAPIDVGTPEFNSYILYWGKVGETWQAVNFSSTFTSWTLSGLAQNSYYSFVLTATNGAESDISNEQYYTANVTAVATTSQATTSGTNSGTTTATTTKTTATGTTSNSPTNGSPTTTTSTVVSGSPRLFISGYLVFFAILLLCSL